MSADRLYQRRWASTLIEHVLKRLKKEYRATGNAFLFDSLKLLLPDEPDAPSRAEIAATLGMSRLDRAQRHGVTRLLLHVLDLNESNVTTVEPIRLLT